MLPRLPITSFVLLNADRVQLDKSWNYKNVSSSFYRILYIRSGTGVLLSGRTKVELEKGFIYLIPSFTTCSYRCNGTLDQTYLTFFEESAGGLSVFRTNRKIFRIRAHPRQLGALERILLLNPDSGIRSSFHPRVFERESVLGRFRNLSSSVPYSHFLETCGLLVQLVSSFVGTSQFDSVAGGKIDSKTSAAIQYMQNNLAEEITVAALAADANQHPDHFSKCFLVATGKRPLQFLNALRTEHAQLLLASTTVPIGDIAIECGFDSLAYFARVFREQTGCAARDYRKRIRESDTYWNAQ
ncbi:MAG: helix-turn-helix domain-containing protein [Chitinophagaceae bacterium]|nr:MAG: helix-turn-helix domain-containing protein [Chitinophagaceae bacterium]